MASGVSVTDDVVAKFQDLKMYKKYEFVTMNFSADKKSIQVVDCGTLEGATHKEKWENFVSTHFLDQKPIYAIFDFKYDECNKDVPGSKASVQTKVVFITWGPDDSPIKEKMLIASSKDALKKKFQGVQAEIQASDRDEVTFDYIQERASKSKK